jgi:uncharacterized protein (TIGR02118 family)
VHKVLVLYPPPPDPEAFRSYYEGTHLALAAKLPGMRRFNYAFEPQTADGPAPYFCVFEAEFDDAAAYGAAMASAEGQAVRADVPNYAPPGTIVINYDMLTPG